ncbi:MAG: 30S ribosomal protein S10 [Halodesulfurarchaeum sp.]
MTVMTRIRLRSGDRATLESVVADIKETCQRKGAEVKGPHSDTPEEYSVSLYPRLDGKGSATYPDWNLTVYQRRFEVRGYEDLVREILAWEFPDSVRVEASVETKPTLGSS